MSRTAIINISLAAAAIVLAILCVASIMGGMK